MLLSVGAAPRIPACSHRAAAPRVVAVRTSGPVSGRSARARSASSRRSTSLEMPRPRNRGRTSMRFTSSALRPSTGACAISPPQPAATPSTRAITSTPCAPVPPWWWARSRSPHLPGRSPRRTRHLVKQARPSAARGSSSTAQPARWAQLLRSWRRSPAQVVSVRGEKLQHPIKADAVALLGDQRMVGRVIGLCAVRSAEAEARRPPAGMQSP